jgi:TLD
LWPFKNDLSYIYNSFVAVPAKDSNDLITNLFSRFLPKPSDVGLNQIDKDKIPDFYPCVKDIWADLLPSDESDVNVKLIRQLLFRTNLQSRKLQLLYSGNRDGWQAIIFHKKVDKQGPAIVLCKTASGGIFGGYNPTGWVNYGEYRGSIAAFLFVFLNGDVTKRPIKLQKIGGAGLAQIDDGSGPKFGAEGLTIALERSNPKKV